MATKGADCDACQKRCVAGADKDLPRRSLLLAGVAFALPACAGKDGSSSADSGPGAEGGADGEAGACDPTCAQGSATYVLTFDEYPELKKVGGSVIVSPPGYSDPACHNDFVIVVQQKAGQFVALSASCTHECCQVAWQASSDQFHCPCHGSIFSATGAVIQGPAAIALPAFPGVCADDCGVYLTIP